MRYDSSVASSLSESNTDDIREKSLVGKAEAMRTHNLERTLPTPVYTRTVKGTDAVESGTKNDYEQRWKHFHAFCILVGFYTCALLLDRDGCPDRPIPVEIDTIRLYVAYMTYSTDDVLVHPDTQETIRDVMGNVVYCTATWNSPGNLNKFRASMLALDSLHAELTGPEYLEKCDACYALTTRSRKSRNRPTTVTHSPCDLHTDGARVRSRGCTMNDPKVKLYLAYMANHLKDYKKKGNIQLLPSEVRRIRTALLAENSIEGLQYWTMVLMGIKLFLRISELISIKVEDFDPELMMLESTSCYVSALAVRIKGKGGDYNWLSMYVDDDFPDLCPIRALLLYISLSGITKGYIFPSVLPSGVSTDDSGTECTGDKDDPSTLHYQYPVFMSKMKDLLTRNLARDMGVQDIFGTHILRKTAYLFAIFGMLRQYGGEVRNLHDLLMTGIMDSARHVCIRNVKFYSRDAATRFEWDKAKRHRTENDVPDWRSIHISDTNVIRAATEGSRTEQQHLSKIALIYLTKFLGFSVQVPVADAVEKAFSKPTTPAATESSADLYVKERMSAKDYEDYLGMKSTDDVAYVAYNPVMVVPRTVPLAVANPKATKMAYGNELRPTLKGKSVTEKIRILGSMFQSDKQLSPSTFTASYRTFFYCKVKPVGLCLVKCFDGDIAQFGERLQELPNKGKYECCSDCKSCQSSSV
jgi:integrase